MDKNILLLKDIDKYAIDDNPRGAENIKRGFKLYEFGNEDLKGCILRVDSKDIPLDEYKDNSLYIVESELYNNVYYPIDKYNEYYEKDFKNLIRDITWNMGAIKIKIYSKREEINIDKEENNIKAKVKVNSKIEVDSELKHNKSSMSKVDKNIEQELEIEREKEKAEKTKMTKEEFSNWIEKEGINEKASIFKSHIENFKKFGEAHGLLKLNEEKSELSRNVYKTYTGIKVCINGLPSRLDSVKSSLSINFNSYKDNERKLIKKFYGYIEF